MDTAFAGISLGLSVLSGAFSASAQRKSARAQMAALTAEKNWNLGVMRQNKLDTYARNILESYGSGINYSTGSTRAVIENNQRVLEDEIKFRESQYDIELANLKAQSKQRYLGIF